MAFFPREFYVNHNTGFQPLFRLLEDFDSYSRQHNGRHNHRNHVPTFQPKFDVRELDDVYEVHGELAGLNKKDVHIEFTDPQTMVVRGRIERTYTAGTAPANLVQNTETEGSVTESGEKDDAPAVHNEHQATVEDDTEEDGFTNVEATPATTSAEVAKPETEKKEEKAADKAKYWVSERSVGEFSRSFHFPGRITQEDVNAKLEDGILTVRVPKAPKHEARRINIA